MDPPATIASQPVTRLALRQFNRFLFYAVSTKPKSRNGQISANDAEKLLTNLQVLAYWDLQLIFLDPEGINNRMSFFQEILIQYVLDIVINYPIMGTLKGLWYLPLINFVRVDLALIKLLLLVNFIQHFIIW